MNIRRTLKLSKLNFKIITILWASIILVLSFLPGSSFPEVEFWSPDKIVHVFIYLVLCTFLGIAIFQTQGKISQRAFILNIIVCISFGCGIEIFQPILTDRYYEFYDIVANSVGTIIGSMIVNLLFNQR